MMIKVKNHQMPPTIRVDRALGINSEPGSMENRTKGLRTSTCGKGLRKGE